PHYAIKSFPNSKICNVFKHFDCASSNEIDFILKLNKDPENIIYANPTKRIADIKFALDHNVNIFTADSIEECQKILNIDNTSKIIMRLSVPDMGATVRFSNKFGVDNFDYGTQIVDLLIDNHN